MKYIFIAVGCISFMLSCTSKIDFDIPVPPEPDGGDGNNATELLITEISTAINTDAATGGSRNHYVEIFNGTGKDVDPSDYALGYQAATDIATLSPWNFAEGNYIIPLGTLADKKCFVIASPQADETAIPRDTSWGTTSTTAANASMPLQLSGNSAIALLKKDEAGTITIDGVKYKLIDVFGSLDVERITASGSSSARNNIVWAIAGATDTRNRTFWRVNTVKKPTLDWKMASGTTPLDAQWELSEDRKWNYSNIGQHTLKN